MHSDKRRLRKELWGPLMSAGFQGQGEDSVKEDGARVKLMEANGGENFQKGMVLGVKCYRRVREDVDQRSHWI